MHEPRSATSPIRFASVLLLLGGLAGCAGTVVSVDPAPRAAMPSVGCAPYEGIWSQGGRNIPITRSGQRLTVNMAAFGRPVAFGRVIGDRHIEASFPDDATFTGVIDGQGSIRWSNGTAWQAPALGQVATRRAAGPGRDAVRRPARREHGGLRTPERPGCPERAHWLASAFRRTVLPFAATAVFLVAVGAAMAAYAPGAKSIGQVVKHSSTDRTGQ